MMCMTELHGGVCHRTSTPHKSGNKMKEKKNGRYSDWTDVSNGVLQGSVLGPKLFLMFINDMEDDVQSRVLKFADATKLYTEVANEEGGEQLQEDLDKCTEWTKQWMMAFNVAKCRQCRVNPS